MTDPREPDQIPLFEYRGNWPLFAEKALKVNLDDDQKTILQAIQNERRVSVRSGHARGKDFIAAVAGLCFLYLYYPSKVIETAPTGRQAIAIMMSEIAKIHNGAWNLGGELLSDRIKFSDDPDHFLMAFKASDTSTEAWTGFHSENLMVIVTEASGIEQQTFDAIEGILTGNSRLLLVFNPNRTAGEAYQSTKSPLYKSFSLSCLNAPNVLAKQIIYPGQVDWEWIDEKIRKPGWVTEIEPSEAKAEYFDFEWEGKWYRPGDLFRVKVLGEFPAESEDQLIPLAWIEAANKRWENAKPNYQEKMRLGADIAGLGADMTVLMPRFGMYVDKPKVSGKSDHMETCGKIKNILRQPDDLVFIDTIGEGAGVFSRLVELKVKNAVSAKFGESAKGFSDFTGEREFVNMRAYCYWAIRDHLDPKFGKNMMLPPIPELTQDLTEPKIKRRSDGQILLNDKSDIKENLGRSPDFGDALALSFYPIESWDMKEILGDSDDEYLAEVMKEFDE